MTRDPNIQAVFAALADPFDPREVKFKPQMVKANRCLAMAYIDARLIQDRLDDVVGGENWQDSYEVLNDGSVICRLSVTVGDRTVTKTDVGSPSEQPDQGDRLKAAFSDALKRCAVKYGIGRYLYRLSAQWVDYDPVKKQILTLPQLPHWAKPAAGASQPEKEKPAPPNEAIRMALADWAERMKGVGTAKDMTDMLPVIKKIKSADVKQAVWDYVTEQASDRGYYYDPNGMYFAEEADANSNDPIPF